MARLEGKLPFVLIGLSVLLLVGYGLAHIVMYLGANEGEAED